jgi:hypothetical protein
MFLINVKLNDTSSDAPDAHFNKCLIGIAQADKFGNPFHFKLLICRDSDTKFCIISLTDGKYHSKNPTRIVLQSPICITTPCSFTLLTHCTLRCVSCMIRYALIMIEKSHASCKLFGGSSTYWGLYISCFHFYTPTIDWQETYNSH